MQKSAAFLIVTVLLLGVFLITQSQQNGALVRLETVFVDWISLNTARPVSKSHITLVEINDSSLGGGNQPWPWSQLEFALFFQAVFPFGPDVLAIEPVLSWENSSKHSPAFLKQRQYQSILHDAILKAPKVVLGSQLGFPDDPELVPPMQQAPVLRNIKGDVRDIPEFTVIDQQPAEDLRISVSPGFVNVPYQGEITRKAPLLFRYRGQVVPSLPLQALISFFKLTLDNVIIAPGSYIDLGTSVRIPIDAAGRMTVDFKSEFTRFGYDDLLLAVEQQQNKQSSVVSTAGLRGCVAILARTDKASRTLLFPTACRGSSGELAAMAVATVQNKAFVSRVSHLFDFTVIAIMMVFGCFYDRFGKSKYLFISFVVLLGYLFLCMSIYELARVWLPIILPLGLLLVVNLFSMLSPRTPDTAGVLAS